MEIFDKHGHSGGKTGGVVIRARRRHLPIQIQPAPSETRPEDPSGRRPPPWFVSCEDEKVHGSECPDAYRSRTLWVREIVFLRTWRPSHVSLLAPKY